VVPRRGFRIAAALAGLARRLPVLMVGGNHDRWGGDFWERDAGVRFHPDRLRFHIGARDVVAVHGDGLSETRRRAALLHRIINHPATSAVYRALHPDLGLRLVDSLSPHLGDHTMDEAKLEEAGRRQQAWAEALLARETGLGLVIMGHTHRAALIRDSRGAEYLNPGAWFDGLRYAVAGPDRSELRAFN
jgi:UDP-2,3-diacylglucosamine hydrolase